MNVCSRFAVAVHTLALLALAEEQPVTSEFVADSVNTNPVVIRRILGALREAGLVTSQPGAGGGWKLTRRPETITLLDVYQAVEEKPLFALHHRPPNQNCRVGRNIQSALTAFFGEAETAMEQGLARRTVAEVLRAALEV